MAGYDRTCQACGDKEPGWRYPVLEKLSDGDPKQIMVCENCVPHFEKVEYLLQRSDGQLSPTGEGHPRKWWKNERPLHYTHGHIAYYMLEQVLAGLDEQQRSAYLQERALDPTRLPFEDFPLVEDFEVSLETTVVKQNIKQMLVPYFSALLYSPSLGFLGSFSGHVQSDYLCRSDFVIPHGDFLLPYYDFEQGIDLLITEDDQFVYILFGDWESHNPPAPEGVWQKIENYYESWVKIRREQYYEQWEMAIQWSRVYHGGETSS